MSDKKIYKKLPAVLQTDATRNFFDNTVEQLYSKANSESIQGYIGSERSSDYNVTGKFLSEPTATRRFYALSPAINTINDDTGNSEKLAFYDEFINYLSTFNINTKNHNKLFSEEFATFLPPIDIDKLINFQEYYWLEDGPSTITIEGSLANPIDIDQDIINKIEYLAVEDNIKFRNGMVIQFSGNFVIPQSKVGKEYIVEGVGKNILLIEKDANYSTTYTKDKDYLLQQRGAKNANAWSRINFWYHADVIRLSGDALPSRSLRANRPIVEFNREVELFNHGSIFSRSVDVASPRTFAEVDGVDVADGETYLLDGVDVLNANSNVIAFVFDTTSNTNYLWETELVTSNVSVTITGDGTNAEATATISSNATGRLGFIEDITVTVSGSGYNTGTTNVIISAPNFSDGTQATAQAVILNGEITDITITNPGAGYYNNSSLRLNRVASEDNLSGVVDGDIEFLPYVLNENDTVQVLSGETYISNEYVLKTDYWTLAQKKYKTNQAPCFNLYDKNKIALHDPGTYPASTFDGSFLFNYSFAPESEINASPSSVEDSELGFTVYYKQFKASSEILFENHIQTERVYYTPIGATSREEVTGYRYYKLIDNDGNETYENYWKTVEDKSEQRIVTTYRINEFDVDRNRYRYYIGCVPNILENKNYDIFVYLNNTKITAYSYVSSGYIDIDPNTITLTAGDFLEISAASDSGLLSDNTISKYEIPISWEKNVTTADVNYISEPEYLEHFADFMGFQEGFTGETLSLNNFSNTRKNPKFANKIIRNNHDVVLAGFLLDNEPYNLVDAIRFNAGEYFKYKSRLKSEINKYYETQETAGLSKEYILEQVLRSILSFKVGKNVFNRTYIVPFGDNYIEEIFTTPLILSASERTFTTTAYADLDLLENSLLVYINNELAVADLDYVITSYNPITIEIQDSYGLQVGDIVVTKLYDANRDSAECPPTPSTMGLYPLYPPGIEYDNSFATPLQVIVGHDGSKTATVGDIRDEILLEFEKRVYNAAKGEFRENNSIPQYSLYDIRPGAFRNTGYDYRESYNLMHPYYSSWAIKNELDGLTNEFYNEENEFSWNYGDENNPGHWKGWYLYYYDTVRPNTHPWEMLGFTEKPLWWAEEYKIFNTEDILQIDPIYDDYSSINTKLWEDLEQGIIRQGVRENLTNNKYLTNNPFRRLGLHEVIPVDATGVLISPFNLNNTGTTILNQYWTNTDTGDHDPGHVVGLGNLDHSYRTSSFLNIDGVNVAYDSVNVYVKSNAIVNHNLENLVTSISGHKTLDNNAIENKTITYNFPRQNLNIVPETPSEMEIGAVAVLINGLPLYNIQSEQSWNSEEEWNYNLVQQNYSDVESTNGVIHYHLISPEIAGLTEWNTEEHSPIVGWAFDGLPIYGPYVYSDPSNVSSNVSTVKSPWILNTDLRTSGPGGQPTGLFVEDYELDGALEGTDPYTNRYNLRYAFTPESPTSKIWFYVVTLDDDGEPMFPYHVGGGIKNSTQWGGLYYSSATAAGRIERIVVTDAGGLYTQANTSVVISGDGSGATANVVVSESGQVTEITLTSAGSGYTEATVQILGDGVRAKAVVILDSTTNKNNQGYYNESANVSLQSIFTQDPTVTGKTNKSWIFSDLSPVEYAWSLTENFPYAVVETMLLSKPGLFATAFSDPLKLEKHNANPSLIMSKVTGEPWRFLNENDFVIHGDLDSDGNFITNIGYTQFIHSWLKFQGLDTVSNFIEPLRTVNIKLAHRMAGFIDKDTSIFRTDQYSTTGDATSLVIPKENIDVVLHDSRYISKNVYSGVVVEKTGTGFKVKGYDVDSGYFTILESDKTGRRQNVEVGGDPVNHVTWQSGNTYKKGTIVEYRNNYYRAPVAITANVFDRKDWIRLPSLPQENYARGVLYQETTGKELRVYYGTEYTDYNDVYDFLISLGRYQESRGFNFGEYDSGINAVKNWEYSAKQFLFWVTGKWEIGNTINLSPLSSKVRLEHSLSYVAKINRTEREQFSLMSESGAAIEPTDCGIIRDENYIEICPPTNTEIYFAVLYLKQLEHAVVFDNTTVFNDVLFNDVLSQRHRRLRVKATKSKNWTGSLRTQGFIVQNDELLPNLDNLAESIGRYNEFGFVPVEKQVYDASRRLFGFQQRNYLTELEVSDEQQFEFYRGMIQNKGTSTSLSRLGRSSAIIQGDLTVFDEWAIKVADFGDTQTHQDIELKLIRTDIKQDPQLYTLDFPEDVTNIVSKLDILEARYTYTQTPTIEISAPPNGEQATGVLTLDANGKINSATVINPGSGYLKEPKTNIIASNIIVGKNDTRFNSVTATQSNSYIDLNKATMDITLADNITATGNITLNLTAANATFTTDEITDAINSNALLNVNITASIISSHYVILGVAYTGYSMILSGKDFTVVDGANISLENGRYQPRQRYSILSAQQTVEYSTSEEDISVYIDGVLIPQYDSGNLLQWNYDPGSIITVTADQNRPILDFGSSPDTANGEYAYDFVAGSEILNITFSGSDNIATENLDLDETGAYRFVDVFIDDIPIVNVQTDYNWDVVDGNVVTSNVSGSLYTLSETGITFNDVSKLPSQVLTVFKNPPLTETVPDGTQRDTYYALTPSASIKIIEKSTVEFTSNVTADLPNKEVNFKVTSNEAIVARISARRNYEVSLDAQDDDTILIDIDDFSKFLKRPQGVRQYKLWPTTEEVNFSGVTKDTYTTIRNSGYVSEENVDFLAYDVASLPDLFDDQFIFKPKENSFIHLAVSEDQDWNVFKLNRVEGTESFLYKNLGGEVSLFTDYSLFNYIDTNLLQTENTGKYLDHYLTIENASVSDQVVVWSEENIIRTEQTRITNFEAPRMIEAIIRSIGPAYRRQIVDITPGPSRTIQGLTVTPLNDGSNTVIISGRNMGTLRDGDSIQLIDNIGDTISYRAAPSIISGNVLYLDATFVSNITIGTAGTGYKAIPTVTIDASPAGANYSAQATASISGDVDSISVTSTSDFTVATAGIQSALNGGNTALISTTIKGELLQIDILEPGLGYSNLSLPTITITGSNTSTATASVTDVDLGPAGELLRIRVQDPGADYSNNDVTVTISGGTPTVAATATATVVGNVEIAVTDGGNYINQVPTLSISGDGTSATATAVMNASVTGFTITDGGAGYSSVPAVTISGGSPSVAATGTAVLDQGVSEIDTQVSAKGSGNVKVRITGTIDPALEFAGIVTAEKTATLEKIQRFLNKSYPVDTVASATGIMQLTPDSAIDANMLSNISVLNYEVTVLNDYTTGLSTPYYEISNTTNSSFTITRGATGASSRAMAVVYDKSVVEVTNHKLSVGEVIRIRTNAFKGTYEVQSVKSANTFVISAPFISNFTEGVAFKKGIKINTAGPHGITPLYAASGKRIAVHFADPLYYNKVYPINSVTPDSLIIKNIWPVSDETRIYYDVKKGTLNGSSPYDGNIANINTASNIIKVFDKTRLVDRSVYYSSNSVIVPANAITFLANAVVIDSSALPSNTSSSVEIIVQRQEYRHDNRYPLLTTLDHNTVNMNGSTVVVDSFNSPEGLVSSLNRNIKLKAAHIKPTKKGLKFEIGMLKDFNTPTINGKAAYLVHDSGGYIKDSEIIEMLSNNTLSAEGQLVLASTDETLINPEFNKGPISVGPTRGLTTIDETTGVQLIYREDIAEYVPVVNDSYQGEQYKLPSVIDQQKTAPEFHVTTPAIDTDVPEFTTITANEAASLTYPESGIPVYGKGDVIQYENNYYIANEDILPADLVAFTPGQWTATDTPDQALTDLAEEYILKAIPGTGGGTYTTLVPGQTLRSYNMLLTTTFTSPVTVEVPRYRLMPNRYNIFEIYQAVQNIDDTIYYILIDKSYPPSKPHNYFETVNRYSDFGATPGNAGYPTTDFYYVNQIIPSYNGSYKITNSNDPILRDPVGSVLGSIPPVEPALYLGPQLVPEPFAVTGGNGTDPAVNFESLPDLTIETDLSTNQTRVLVDKSGYTEFLMWTPGLEPGKWKPTEKGPGKLPGINGDSTTLGFGRGYYAENDDHDPLNYPVTKVLTWDQPLPRFLYSKKFKVSPITSNFSYSVYVDEFDNIVDEALKGQDGVREISYAPEYLDIDDENVANTGMRPEEVYVACFWTEPFLYKNQLVGWDSSVLDTNKLPTPVYNDYQGTITRLKYIRLTELPNGVQTRRIIPDTGWAGKEWNNFVTDDLNFDTIGTPREDSIWDQYAPSSTISGSSNDPVESQAAASQTVASTDTPISYIDPVTGEFTSSEDPAEVIPNTDIGPILNMKYLESLQTYCDATDSPVIAPRRITSDCGTVKTKEKIEYINNFTGIKLPAPYAGGSEYYAATIKVANQPEGASRCIGVFDFLIDNSVSAGSVVMVQSKKPFDETNVNDWIKSALVRRSTQNNGDFGYNNGTQIGRYGVTQIDTNSGTRLNRTFEELLGITATFTPSDTWELGEYAADDPRLNTLFNMHLKDFPTFGVNLETQVSDANLSVKGLGWIQRSIDCKEGEYVTFIIKTDVPHSDDQLQWQLAISYYGESLNDETDSDVINAATCEEDPAHAYAQGAVRREWRATSSPGTNGYFGQWQHSRETPEHPDGKKAISNIFFPYGALPQASSQYHFGGNHEQTSDQWAGGRNVQLVNTSIVRNLNQDSNLGNQGTYQIEEWTTVEVKGYFKAPYTGTYTFSARADDGLYAWISGEKISEGNFEGRDSLHPDGEYFTLDGYRDPSNPKHYSFDNYIIRTGWRVNSFRESSKLQSQGSITLEKDKFYFVRILYGNGHKNGYIKIDYSINKEDGGTVSGQQLSFTGRTCDGTNPPSGSGQSTANSGYVNLTPGSGSSGGSLVFQGTDFTGINATEAAVINALIASTVPGFTTEQWQEWSGRWQGYTDCESLPYRIANGTSAAAFYGVPSGTAVWTNCALKAFTSMGVCPIGYNEQCKNIDPEYDTPIINPAPGSDPENDNTDGGNNANEGNSGGGTSSQSYNKQQDVLDYVGNSSPYGQKPMTGFSYMPSSFKTGRRKIVNVNRYGYKEEVDPSKYISGTHQRVTGGFVLPLTKQVSVISKEITPLKSQDIIVSSPWYRELQDMSEINKTTRFINYDPLKVGSTYYVNGKKIRNVTTGVKAPNVVTGQPALSNDQGIRNTVGGLVPRNTISSYGITNNSTGLPFVGEGGAITPSGGDNTSASSLFPQAAPTASTVGATTINPPAFGVPGITSPQDYTSLISNNGLVSSDLRLGEEPVQNQVFDNNYIRFNDAPVIEITPLVIDASGGYGPAGPTAQAQLYRPTPMVSISELDTIGIEQNSELIINGRKIVIRGRGITDIANQVNCTDLGIKAVVRKDSDGGERLDLISCDDNGFTIANGCGGGTYKQVGDFHINRGFDQQLNSTVTRTVTDNATLIPFSVGSDSFVETTTNYNNNQQILATRQTSPKKVPFQFLNENGDKIINEDTGEIFIKYYTTNNEKINTFAPTVSESTANTTVYSTGGSGYRIGDRLRLVGGTPINNNKGPITEICIDSAGAGFTNAANLQVIFNPDGQATGIGAAAIVTELDDNGGIAAIELLNSGYGYDINNPPKIEIYDRSQSNQQPVTISAAYPQQVTVDEGRIVRIETLTEEISRENGVQSLLIADHQYYLVTKSVDFGANVTHTIANTAITYEDPTESAFPVSRVKVTVDTTATGPLSGYIRQNSYVELSYTNGSGDPVVKKYWVPSSKDGDVTIDPSYFILESTEFESEAAVTDLFASSIVITAVKPWNLNLTPTNPGEKPALVPSINPDIAKVLPNISARIGTNPEYNGAGPEESARNRFIQGYSGFAGPQRVAKFIVTGVDDNGGITQLKIIDRGIYDQFPSDLTFGVPLEYDYEAKASGKGSRRDVLMGVTDPSRDNIEYGDEHPEYSVSPFVDGKHPDWSSFTEFYFDGEKYQFYTGSPGEYDPQTFVIIDTQNLNVNAYSSADNLARAAINQNVLLSKQYAIEYLDSTSSEYGAYKNPLAVPGGTGARVFLTAQAIPHCNDKGRAKETLGLPDEVTGINVPEFLSGILNDALTDAGYLPEDIVFDVGDYGDIGSIILDSDYPGINIGSPTPGILDVLDFPEGDWNNGMLCIDATLEDPKLTDEEAVAQVEEILSSGAFGFLTEEDTNNITGEDKSYVKTGGVLTLLCVNRLGEVTGDPTDNGDGGGGGTPGGGPWEVNPGDNDWTEGDPGSDPDGNFDPTNPQGDGELNPVDPFGGGFYGGGDFIPSNDNNSIFGPGQIRTIRELYKYDITNIFGEPVQIPTTKISSKVNYFESHRFNNRNVLNDNLYQDNVEEEALEDIEKAWVDNYNNTGKWAYLEYGVVKRQQEALVDVNNVQDVLVYDPESGEKLVDFYKWDPFKGILPEFIQKEISFISETDPVNYNNARTLFGRDTVGRVWWDTSSVRYMWYEQGPNRERAENWGKAFPGSSITVCEWVESRSIPANWRGNGTPRWSNRYVTQRHVNPETGNYEQYYYYWVQNRSVLDDAVVRNFNRRIDTETLAKYIANPVGYGITLANFVSEQSFTLANMLTNVDLQESHLQIGIDKEKSIDSLNHSAWKLLREGDNNSIIPDFITNKFIDSISGENAIGQRVPDENLSVVEKYGIKFRPRQTMFKNIKEARRTLVEKLNSILANIKLNTQFKGWDSDLTTPLTYLQVVNWYEVNRIDSITNIPIRYDESYKPIFNVSSVSELYTLKNLPDGSVIQVRNSQNDSEQLWIYSAPDSDFKLISIVGDTVKLRSTAYTDETNAKLSSELREILLALKDNVFVNTTYWNELVFEMIKYAYLEQGQLDWAFKTSYLYIEKEEDDLIQITGFKPDNFQKVVDYINEVKPYTAKIREYKDGKRTPIEYIGQNGLSDFDKPPYVDSESGNVRVLDDFVIADANILANDPQYTRYYSIFDKTQDPFRKVKTKLLFDRTHWRLTQYNWDPVVTTINYSIAQNISNITQMTVAEVDSNIYLRATDRLFKYDADIVSSFNNEVNVYFNDTTASSNADIVGNVEAMHQILEAGQLKNTLALVKDKVGGNFRGETLDGNVFSLIGSDGDYFANVTTQFGFDTQLWDENTDNDTTLYTDSVNADNYGNVTSIGIGDVAWDTTIEIVSYEGIFNTLTDGPVTLRRNNETYEGFDGVTFQRVAYGEERPEEMAIIDPLESVIFTVTTRPETYYTYDFTDTTQLGNYLPYITDSGDLFGGPIAVGEDFVVVGAAAADSGATSTGNVYVYEKDTFAIRHVFTNPNNADSFGLFGGSITTERDLIYIGTAYDDIGVNNLGQVHVYSAQTGSLLNTITYPGNTSITNTLFGASLASNDRYIAIGARGGEGNGSVNIYAIDFTDGSLTPIRTHIGENSGDLFGASVEMDDTHVYICASDYSGTNSNSGKLYAYNLVTGQLSWSFEGDISERIGRKFGVQMKPIDIRGNLIAVGAYTTQTPPPGSLTSGDKVILLNKTTGELLHRFIEPQDVVSGGSTINYFGSSIALGVEQILIGAPDTDLSNSKAGRVYVYNLNTYELEANIDIDSDIFSNRKLGLGLYIDRDTLYIGSESTSLGVYKFTAASSYSDDATDNIDRVSPSASTVIYRTHMNLFGNTDYLRILDRTSTVLLSNVTQYSETIELQDGAFLPQPTITVPGSIWVGSEIIQFGRREGNTLSLLIRGALGTTIDNHTANTVVYSAENIDEFNTLNPQANIWLELGTKYDEPFGWDEAVDNTPSDPNDNDWTPLVAWDEIAAGNITISNASAVVSDVTNTTANLTLASNLTLAVDEGIKITNTANTSITDVVRVTDINGSVISIVSSFAYGPEGNLDVSNLFVNGATVTVSSFNYAGQGDGWDSATLVSQTALSLADRANANYTDPNSIMRFLHDIG